MKQIFVRFFLGLAVACLTACASLGVPPADTFAKKLAAGYATVQTVAESGRTLWAAGKLTGPQAQHVHDVNAEALAALDAAGTMAKTDLSAADTRLTTTITVLAGLQAFLATQQGVK